MAAAAAARVALPVLAASSVSLWGGPKLWGLRFQELPESSPLFNDEISMPAGLEEKEVEQVDDEEELPVEGISECAVWSEAICLIMLVVELFKRLRQCCSSRQHRDYAAEVCMQDDEENEHEDEELEDAELEALEVKSVHEADETKNVYLQTEEPQELAVEAVDAVDQTKGVSLQPEEPEKLGVEAVDEVSQAKKVSSESTAQLADVPSPARMAGGTRLRSMKKSSKCPLQRAEALLAEDPQLASEAADCTIPEDEEWDDRAFHQGRSESLATFVAAYKFLKTEVRGLKAELKQLNDAGLSLQDEVERLMNENRNLEGDIAYWRELAESMSPEKSRRAEETESELSEGESPVKGCQLEEAESERSEGESPVECCQPEEAEVELAEVESPVKGCHLKEAESELAEGESLVEGAETELATGESPVKENQLDEAELLDKEGTENQQVEEEGSAQHEGVVGEQQVCDEEAMAVHRDAEAEHGEQQIEEDRLGEHAQEEHVKDEDLLQQKGEGQMDEKDVADHVAARDLGMNCDKEARVQNILDGAGSVGHGVEREPSRSEHKPEAPLGFEHGDHSQQDESKLILESSNELEQGYTEQIEGQDLVERDNMMGLHVQQIREEHHVKDAVFPEHREDVDFFDGDETEGKQQVVDLNLGEDANQADLDTDQAQDVQQVEGRDDDLARHGEQLGLGVAEDSDNLHAEHGNLPKQTMEIDHTLEGRNQQQVTDKDLAENLEEPRLRVTGRAAEQQVTSCEFADQQGQAQPEGQTSKTNDPLGHEKDMGQADDDDEELDGKARSLCKQILE